MHRGWPFPILFLVLVGSLRAADPAPGGRDHWAFRGPGPVQPPVVRTPGWALNPVDTFVLARLERAGLMPAPPAGRATLLRRVTLDLTGLPPTPEELEAFLEDTRPDAYVRVVNRLLASPHYGERWAQHWLDVVRYADSNGFEADTERPQAWRYRDYVVRSLNADKPYDQFVTEQVAGDLLAGPGKAQGSTGPRADLLVAAGFNRCGPVHKTGGNVDPAISRQEVLTEMTTTVGAAVLGLTMNCARCHDHKFDPISQADYYRFQAFFAGATYEDADLATEAERAESRKRHEDWKKRREPLEKELAALEKPYRERVVADKKARLEPPLRAALDVPADKRTAAEKQLAAHAEILLEVVWNEVVDLLSPADRQKRAGLRARLHALDAERPPPQPQAWTVEETRPTPPTHLLKRGDPRKRGAKLEPAFPPALGSPRRETLLPPRDRADLARWLTRPDQPLTARVVVNRLWQHHFGHGLVRTPNDFGRRGEPPTHPELLDWLARELVDHGWSLKHVHRLLLLSATYQQSSRASDPQAARLDPDNRLLARANRQRLEGEALRDSALAVAGTFNRRPGGPMVRVPLEPEVYELIFTEEEPDGLWPVTPDPREHTRRSLYLYAKRNVRLPLLEAFDQPDTLTPCAARAVSTYAPQALILLNGPFLQAQSRAFAARLSREAGPDRAAQVERAYRLALARPPRPVERDMALPFLEAQTNLLRERVRSGVPGGEDRADVAALADFCLALFNRNEFVYVD